MALIDVVWSAGLGVAAIAYLCHLPEPSMRSGVVLGVLLLWSGRSTAVLAPTPCIAAAKKTRAMLT